MEKHIFLFLEIFEETINSLFYIYIYMYIYIYIVLDETDYISHSTNTLGKGINLIILLPAMGKW